MPQCQGLTKARVQCSRDVKGTYCWNHEPKEDKEDKLANSRPKISGKRQIGDFSIFNTTDAAMWEAEYTRIMDAKYSKHNRNFSTVLTGTEWQQPGEPPIFLVPRTRGGPGYTTVALEGVSSKDVVYCPISKGYPMQEVSSFTLGPIIGEGLCLVNAAFSKSVCVMHIEGGGQVDLGRKSFWRRSRNPPRNIQVFNESQMFVNGELFNIHDWLRANEALWLETWELWRKSVALSSRGDFHWCDDTPTLAYRHTGEYLTFVEWKRNCYIKPSYDLLPFTRVFQHLRIAWQDYHRPLGLVHPKAISDHPEARVTREYLHELFNSPSEMCCQPFVVAGLLLGVAV